MLTYSIIATYIVGGLIQGCGYSACGLVSAKVYSEVDCICFFIYFYIDY